MAKFKLLGSMNISCAKKVLVILLIIILIGFILMDSIHKMNVYNVNKFVQGYINHQHQDTKDKDTVVGSKSSLKDNEKVATSSATIKLVSLNPDTQNHNAINGLHRNKFESKNKFTLKDAEAKTKTSVQNEAPTFLSAEKFYKDPRNILPGEQDPVKASNVSWVSFLSPSEKDVVYEEYTKMGIESTVLHSSKSPYIIDPRIYKTPVAANTTSDKGIVSAQVKRKIISCYACKEWAKIDWPPKFNDDLKKCPYCQLDIGGKMIPEADAVIFFPSKIGKKPVPKRSVGQIWIMAEQESPIHFYYPKSYEPWKSVFNWTFTYRIDSDIFSPYARLAWRKQDRLLSDEEYLSIAKQKTKTAAWFVSNCKTQSKRKEFVAELQKYIDVDIYGKCGTKQCGQGYCEKNLTTTYKFYLSFENSFCKDYVTEKLFRSYHQRTHVIPVTRGGFDYHKYIPSGGYVNAGDFKSPKELGLFLKELGNDVKRYAEMLKEKDRLVGLGYGYDWCDICEKLHTRSTSENKIIPDIKYWSHTDTCFDPPGWEG